MDNWKEREYSDEKISFNGLNKYLTNILKKRSVTGKQQIVDFLHPSLHHIHSPFYVPNILRAYHRIQQAITNKEKILIYGDSDVDGITSIAILYDTLLKFSPPENILYYVPDSNSGYGLNQSILDDFITIKKVSLIITVDCGISNIDEIKYASSLKTDVIITDHHNPPEKLPAAYFILNPKVFSNDSIIYTELSGCGISFIFSLGYQYFCSDEFNKSKLICSCISEKNKIHISFLEIVNMVPQTDKTFTLIKDQDNTDTSADIIKYINNKEIIIFEEQSIKQVFVYILSNTDKIFSELNILDLQQLLKNNYKLQDYSFFAVKKYFTVYHHSEKQKLQHLTELFYIYINIYFQTDPEIGKFLNKNLFLAGLGTVADVSTMHNTNRALVKGSLEYLARSQYIHSDTTKDDSLVADALTSKFSLARENITEKDYSWKIGPFLNSAGRMDKAETALKLILADNSNSLIKSISDLDAVYQERRKISEDIFKNLIQKCDQEQQLVFVYEPDIITGITGLIAARLLDKANKPVIVIGNKNNEFGVGSFRSPQGYNSTALLTELSSLLVKFGGHDCASGFTIRLENISKFEAAIKKSISQKKVIKQIIHYDIPAALEDFNINDYNELQKLHPYGLHNEEPVYLAKNVNSSRMMIFGKKKNHIKIILPGSGRAYIGWNLADEFKQYLDLKDLNVDLLYILEMDIYHNDLRGIIQYYNINIKKV